VSAPEDTGPPPMELDRRTALVWMGIVAAAIGGAEYFGLGNQPKPITGPGYGRDPNLVDPGQYWSRTMTGDQLAAIAQLCDFILPAEGPAPSASALKVHEFIDEWISAPYPDQAKDRLLILDGLGWMNHEASRRANAASFGAASRPVREAILTDLADATSAGKVAPKDFYARVRKLVIGAYYTTEAGFKDIGYIGNVPLSSYPGPSPEVLAALDAACGKLGLA
jgi:Gluconate 2-dehydrogenase subunit 3